MLLFLIWIAGDVKLYRSVLGISTVANVVIVCDSLVQKQHKISLLSIVSKSAANVVSSMALIRSSALPLALRLCLVKLFNLTIFSSWLQQEAI